MIGTGMGLGTALELMRAGFVVQRAGWNGKGMHIGIVTAEPMTVPFVYMYTADGNRVPWLCSQTDLLATDWQLVVHSHTPTENHEADVGPDRSVTGQPEEGAPEATEEEGTEGPAGEPQDQRPAPQYSFSLPTS